MEIWDVYDEYRGKTGKTIERGIPLLAGNYHLVVHIWVVNKKGELLIQKRAKHLAWKPGIWAVTGGSAIVGEDAYTAAIRELSEEVGIDGTTASLEFLFELKRHDSFCNVFLARCNTPAEQLKLQQEEVDAAAWVSREQLQTMIEHKEFYSYDYLPMLYHYLSMEQPT